MATHAKDTQTQLEKDVKSQQENTGLVDQNDNVAQSFNSRPEVYNKIVSLIQKGGLDLMSMHKLSEDDYNNLIECELPNLLQENYPVKELILYNGIMHLNDAGRMVQAKIANIPHYYPDVSIDIFIVMPDHVHAVVMLDGEGRTRRFVPTDVGLSEVIKNIKTYTTTRYIQGIREHHWQPFNKRLWQRRYYERIIRNSNDLNKIRPYIINNPMTWHLHQK